MQLTEDAHVLDEMILNALKAGSRCVPPCLVHYLAIGVQHRFTPTEELVQQHRRQFDHHLGLQGPAGGWSGAWQCSTVAGVHHHTELQGVAEHCVVGSNPARGHGHNINCHAVLQLSAVQSTAGWTANPCHGTKTPLHAT